MKLIIRFLALIALLPLWTAPGWAETIYIPKDVKVEDNGYKRTVLRNLSINEIYWAYSTRIIGDYIYLAEVKTREVIKLSLQGAVMGRFGREGQGPAEYSGVPSINAFGDHIAIIGQFKVIICTRDLQHLKDVKLKQRFHNLILGRDRKIFFYNNFSWSNYYFTMYSKDFKYLKKFGVKKPGAKEGTKESLEKDVRPKNYRYSPDLVRQTLYVPEENVLWVSFRDRCDLRCYKNEKHLLDIKPRVKMYEARDDAFSGVKIKTYFDFSLLIATHGNRLYYFYRLSKELYCDIFDLSQHYRLVRRLKLKHPYNQLAHHKGTDFYGIRFDEDHENLFLDKIQITLK